MRPRVNLYEHLTEEGRRLLRSCGTDISEVQEWLDTNRWDGCTFAPDLFVVVCAWHDWACRASRLPRWVADVVATLLIVVQARNSEDEKFWRYAGVGYAFLFYVGVRFGAAFGVGRRR